MVEVKELAELSEAEAKAVLSAPALITVMIAAADDNIEAKELSWGAQVVDYRSHIGDEDLYDYYEAAEVYFDDNIKVLMAEEVAGHQDRISHIEQSLTAINGSLDKLNHLYAQKLAKSWRSLATQIAKSSGGVLGFGSISAQEKDLLDLKMITH